MQIPHRSRSCVIFTLNTVALFAGNGNTEIRDFDPVFSLVVFQYRKIDILLGLIIRFSGGSELRTLCVVADLKVIDLSSLNG